VRVTKQGSGDTAEAAEAALKNIELDLAQEGDTVRVRAGLLDKEKQTNSEASAELRVPPAAVLELRTSNGAVTLQGGSGKADVQTSNGLIQAKGRTGSLHLVTSNGAITVQAEKAQVTAQTSNGSVQFGGTLAKGEHSLQTSNGNVLLALPAEAQFRFDAETSLGRIANEFSHERPQGRTGDHLTGSVGQNPSTSIRLRTSNGNIVLRPQRG